MESKKILHLCADIGSDSFVYKTNGYEVITVGADIGVENFNAPEGVYGIFANPPCTEFTKARSGGVARLETVGMDLVHECMRIIKECENLSFWVMENPATGALKNFIGDPAYLYQPWWYGSPWTKKTSLWGKFNIPERSYREWKDVPKLDLPTYQGRDKPSLAKLHYQHINKIPEFFPFIEKIKKKANGCRERDMQFRSLCSQMFANAFFNANR